VFEIAFILFEGFHADDFLDLLQKKFDRESPIVIEADLIKIVIRVHAAEENYLNSFEGWKRLTQWDHFPAFNQQMSTD
jgi:hypothetical protein